MHKILIVDDDKDMVEVYLRALERAGYHCKYAYNGKEGLAELKIMDGADLIILDLQMPKMSGEEFLRILRTESEFEKYRPIQDRPLNQTIPYQRFLSVEQDWHSCLSMAGQYQCI